MASNGWAAALYVRQRCGSHRSGMVALHSSTPSVRSDQSSAGPSLRSGPYSCEASLLCVGARAEQRSRRWLPPPPPLRAAWSVTRPPCCAGHAVSIPPCRTPGFAGSAGYSDGTSHVLRHGVSTACASKNTQHFASLGRPRPRTSSRHGSASRRSCTSPPNAGASTTSRSPRPASRSASMRRARSPIGCPSTVGRSPSARGILASHKPRRANAPFRPSMLFVWGAGQELVYVERDLGGGSRWTVEVVLMRGGVAPHARLRIAMHVCPSTRLGEARCYPIVSGIALHRAECPLLVVGAPKRSHVMWPSAR